MKVIIVFAALVAVVVSGPALKRRAISKRDVTTESSDAAVETEDSLTALTVTVTESDLTYYFYTSSSPSTPIVVTADNVSALSGSFSSSNDTLFTIHGWTDSESSDVNTYIREAVLPKYDINLFVVDWSPIAGENYISAQASVLAVGNLVGSFIQTLISTYGLDASTTTIAGHSLGAHVAGNAGAALGGIIAIIVGLDPAGPLFTTINTANRLDPTDAEFVHVIHTNAGGLGMLATVGDADYWPNGGWVQPGCELDITGSCSHSRSYMYYAESISASTNGFIATQCEYYLKYTSGLCSSNDVSPMGGYPTVDTSASGNYYLSVNSESPYAEG